MDWKRTLEIAGIIVVLVGTGATGSWAVYSNDLQIKKDKIYALEKINKLNYPDFLKNINTAATSLQTHIDTLEDIKNIKIKNSELITENTALEGENKKLSINISTLNNDHKTEVDTLLKKEQSTTLKYENEISKLNSEIEKFNSNSTSFELLAGSGLSLKQGKIQVGFTEGNSYFVCNVTVNNKKYDLEAGSAIDVAINERACKVVLTKCSRNSYEPSLFELVCS